MSDKPTIELAPRPDDNEMASLPEASYAYIMSMELARECLADDIERLETENIELTGMEEYNDELTKKWAHERQRAEAAEAEIARMHELGFHTAESEWQKSKAEVVKLRKLLGKAGAVIDGRLRGIVIMTDDCEGTLAHEVIKEIDQALAETKDQSSGGILVRSSRSK